MDGNNGLVVLDDDFKYGIVHGYYPELDILRKNKQFQVLTWDEARSSGRFRNFPSSSDETAYYVYNPYSLDYSLINDPNVDNDFFISQSVAYKEALVYLGAKEIIIEKFGSDTSVSHQKGSIGGNKGETAAEASVGHENQIKSEISSKLTFSDPENEADIEKAEKYIREHDLSSDFNLYSWLNRLKERGELRGTEALVISYYKELNNAWNIVAKLDVKLVNAKFGYASDFKATRKFEVTIKVDFGQ